MENTRYNFIFSLLVSFIVISTLAVSGSAFITKNSNNNKKLHTKVISDRFVSNGRVIMESSKKRAAKDELSKPDVDEVLYINEKMEYSLTTFCVPRHYSDYLTSILIPNGLIMNRIEKMAASIIANYSFSASSRGEKKNLHMICVLKGASTFFFALMEKMRLLHQHTEADYVPFTFDFIRVSSYVGTSSTGNVKISDGTSVKELKNKDILVVEDIVETGNTLKKLLPVLESHGPSSIKVATLLEKRIPNGCGYKADFVGFSIPDKFVVGYCLDYNEIFRELEHICIINEKGIEKWAE